ncbi:MAG: hypothetical protein LBG05_08150 [Treponema sp.]|nr:hypothetical protein [Treponema sp.]
MKGRFAFEIRWFRLEEARLSFFIRPDDGFQLLRIIQWLKQTFAVRFNVREGGLGTSGVIGSIHG